MTLSEFTCRFISGTSSYSGHVYISTNFVSIDGSNKMRTELLQILIPLRSIVSIQKANTVPHGDNIPTFQPSFTVTDSILLFGNDQRVFFHFKFFFPFFIFSFLSLFLVLFFLGIFIEFDLFLFFQQQKD